VTHALLGLLIPPPGLDGEAASGGNAVLGAISVVSIVFGWLLIAALWHFVFSAKARRRRGEKDPPA
jgi:hypothetical protein